MPRKDKHRHLRERLDEGSAADLGAAVDEAGR
jgi:hypothetical protein